MGLRARLVLAFVLLAVVPLTAVTLCSYLSSERAFRAGAEPADDATMVVLKVGGPPAAASA